MSFFTLFGGQELYSGGQKLKGNKLRGYYCIKRKKENAERNKFTVRKKPISTSTGPVRFQGDALPCAVVPTTTELRQ
jgi:hypothetical protein